ncbi:hypothetical protein N9955_00480 [bacterium]|nr:hypothetical protein [bacterium]
MKLSLADNILVYFNIFGLGFNVNTALDGNRIALIAAALGATYLIMMLATTKKQTK